MKTFTDPASAVSESTLARYARLDGTERVAAIEADAVRLYGEAFPNPAQARAAYCRNSDVNRLYIEAGRQRSAGVAKSERTEDYGTAQALHLAEAQSLVAVLEDWGLSANEAVGEVASVFKFWWACRPVLHTRGAAEASIAKGHERRTKMFEAVAVELQRVVRKSSGAVDVRAELRRLVSPDAA